MKKGLTIFLVMILSGVMLTSLNGHSAEDVIHECYKKVDDQWVIVKDAGQCRLLEVFTSWSQTELQGSAEPEAPASPSRPPETSGTGNVWVAHQGRDVALTDNVAEVMSLTVPAGTYAIRAKVSVSNLDSAVQSAYCALSTGDVNGVEVASAAEDNQQVISLLDAARFVSDTAITLSCLTLNGRVSDGLLTAIEVGNLTQQSGLRRPR